MSGHLLSVRDLRVRFRTPDGPVFAVNGVSLDVDAGETLGLVGESGCGKSVTSLALLRLLPSGRSCEIDGRILFDGTDVLALPDPAMGSLRGRELAMVFQDPMTSLNPVLTIGEQLTETIRAHRRVARTQARAQAVELLEQVGIPRPAEQLHRYPHEFSGGMRQRVLIAIAVALAPKLLIADEPTTALDVTIQAQILELLATLTRRVRHGGYPHHARPRRHRADGAAHVRHVCGLHRGVRADPHAVRPTTPSLSGRAAGLGAPTGRRRWQGRGPGPDRGGATRPLARAARLPVRAALRAAADRVCRPDATARAGRRCGR